MPFADLAEHVEQIFAVHPSRIAGAEQVARRAHLARNAAAVARYRWKKGPRPNHPKNAHYCRTYRLKNLEALRAAARERMRRRRGAMGMSA